MQKLLSAHNIDFIKNDKKILDNVSIEILRNDFVTIIGPNGSGKSSLIKILIGTQEPNSGKVERSDIRIGYVPQRFTSPKTLPISVKSFLNLNKNCSNDEIESIIKETEIDFADKMLENLSGGEMQKVLLARALTNKPDLLVLDEPAQNLDIGNELKFYQLLDRIYKERGISVLMVSHDLHMVMSASRKVICLFHHVCCSGEPHIVAKDPAFISLFGQDMSKLMALYQHSHNHHHHGDEPCTADHHKDHKHDS